MLLLSVLEHSPYGARVLDLDWEIAEDRAQPRITFCAGLGDKARFLGSVLASDLGMPPSIDAARQGLGGSPQLPEALRSRIMEAFPPGDAPVNVILLHFRRRDGYLAMMPWERMLQPPENLAIRRLPYFILPVPRLSVRPNVVLIFDPLGERLSSDWEVQLRRAMERTAIDSEATWHLFAARSLLQHTWWPPYRSNFQPWPSPRVFSSSGPAAVPGSKNLWLNWVQDRLAGMPVDLVLFLCRGAIARSQGVLCLHEPGTGEEIHPGVAPLVNGEELDDFLLRLGARACVLVSSEGSGLSGPGLRLLADDLARRQPGSTLALEANELPELASFMVSVLNPRPLMAPWPFLEMFEPILTAGRVVLEQFTLFRDVGPLFRSQGTAGEQNPLMRWVLAAQSGLERGAARLLEAAWYDAANGTIHIPTPPRPEERPFAMPIEDVFSVKGRGVAVTGRIQHGRVQVGDAVELHGRGQSPTRAVVQGLEQFNRTLNVGNAGDALGILLGGIEPGAAERGQMLIQPGSMVTAENFATLEKPPLSAAASLAEGLAAMVWAIRGQLQHEAVAVER